jgi:DNA-binding SARP family transcriptional activator
VHDLRSRLEPGREARQPSSFIVGRDGAYGLDADRVSVDADSFEQHARAGLGRSPGRRVTRCGAAAALYRGPFLGDEPYADWAFAERDRLHELAIRCSTPSPRWSSRRATTRRRRATSSASRRSSPSTRASSAA